MSRRSPWLTATVLVALLPAMACSLTPLARQPSATPTGTVTPTTTPGPTLARDLAATATPIDLDACAVSMAQRLEDVPYQIGLDELRDVYQLVLYHVGSNVLSQPEYGFAPEELQSYQGDVTSHEQIWHLVASLFPEEERRRIRYLLIYTDGAGQSLAAVRQAGSPYFWSLAVDIQDASSTEVLFTSLVHELGHLITLDDSQVTPDVNLFDHPDDENVYRQAQAACGNYFSLVGCSKINSYINRFFQKFWPDIYDQWLAAGFDTSAASHWNALEKIYAEHPDDFVTEYAVTTPEEDIAESFMYFALSPKPTGDTVAEQKIRFFYGYSALVRARTHILQNLCAPADQP